MSLLTSQTTFCKFIFSGEQAADFLQGQLTMDVKKIDTDFILTAICNLKGRIEFGLWIKKHDNDFVIVLAQDVADAFAAHIKKYGAFSKVTLSEPIPYFISLENGAATFSSKKADVDANTWLLAILKSGQSVICAATHGLYQPQQIRLHQLGGVHYDKGCYLGQEVVSRIWFKATPKAWLHLVKGSGEAPTLGSDYAQHVQVVNSIATSDGFEALVVARPEALEASDLEVLGLPEALSKGVARNGA